MAYAKKVKQVGATIVKSRVEKGQSGVSLVAINIGVLKISTQHKESGNWIEPGRRIMDRAWMRDGDTIYTGEALMLACLLHAKGKTKRGNEEMEQISRMLNDPNLRKEK